MCFRSKIRAGGAVASNTRGGITKRFGAIDGKIGSAR